MDLDLKVRLLEAELDCYKSLSSLQYRVLKNDYIILKDLDSDLRGIKDKLSFLERLYYVRDVKKDGC